MSIQGGTETSETEVKLDRNFNDLVQLFKDRIYGTIKGNYRFDMAIEDIEAVLAESSIDTPLYALDIGGGLGQMTMYFLQAPSFSKVMYFDVSDEMKRHVDGEIERLSEEFNTGNSTDQLAINNTIKSTKIDTRVGGIKNVIQEIFQEVEDANSKALPDVVTLHAVLEWLSSPMEDLESLLTSMKSKSILSLLYYNKIADDKKKKTYKPRKKPRKPSKLTPYHEFHSDDIEKMLIESGFEIAKRTGIRIGKFKQNASDQELETYLEQERQIARVEPFCRQGRYNHIVAIKK